MRGACDRPFGLKVGQQGKAQRASLREGEVIPNAVHRDAEHFGTEALKFGQEFVVERHLIATHRALISRVKREDCRPARKSRKETR